MALDPYGESLTTEEGVRFQIYISWSELGIEPREGVELDLELVVIDADLPTSTLEQKESAVYWLVWRENIRLAG